MKILAWNSQGDKWGPFWTNMISPEVKNQQEDVLGLLVEASWAPWMLPVRGRSVSVAESGLYEFAWREKGDPQWVPGTRNSFCIGIGTGRRRGRSAVWVPWVKNLQGQTNSRCSMGAGFCLVRRRRMQPVRYTSTGSFKFTRPVVRVDLDYGKQTELVVLLVHLVSSSNAPKELQTILGMAPSLLPPKTPAILVGDVNINILTTDDATLQKQLPAGWRPLRSHQTTQASGGELDWALLYDPNGQHGNAAGTIGHP